MDEDYNIYEYDSDNDLSSLTQEPSQTQGEVYGDKSEDEANGENYRLLLKSAADLANLSGNQTCDFEDHIIGIMESDVEFSESDAKEEQLKIAGLEPQPIEKPKALCHHQLQVPQQAHDFFQIFLGISKLVKFDVI